MAGSGKDKYPLNEEQMDIHSYSLNNRHGVSLDIGNSLVKVAYSHQKDDVTSTIHFASFPRRCMDEMFNHVRQTCGDVLKSDINIVHACGSGSHMMKTFIEKALEKEITIGSEVDAFVDGYKFLIDNYPVKEITHSEATPSVRRENNIFDKMRQKWNKSGKAKSQTKVVVEEEVKNEDEDESLAKDMRSLLAIAGTRLDVVQVDQDGSAQLIGGAPFCGKAFLGQGCLLTGAKTFNDLIELASKGDRKNVNKYGLRMKKQEEKEGGKEYLNMPDDVYFFKHAVDTDLGKFPREDLAAGLLSSVCSVVASTVNHAAEVHEAERVFYCGSFMTGLARAQTDIYNTLHRPQRPTGELTEIYFLKYGGYVGALGCLIQGTKDM